MDDFESRGPRKGPSHRGDPASGNAEHAQRSPWKLPDRSLALLGAAALLLVVLGLLYRSPDSPDLGTVRQAAPAREVSTTFTDLRPGPDAKLVLPAVGFRWTFLADSLGETRGGEDVAPSESTDPAESAIRFVFVLADTLGHPLIEEVVSESQGPEMEALIRFPPEIGPGPYHWWVEAVLPNPGGRLRSRVTPIWIGR